MSNDSSLTLGATAQKLRVPEADVAKAALEVLNKQNAIMFSLDEIETLSTHFKEKSSQLSSQRKGGRLSTNPNHKRTSSKVSGVVVVQRKLRGKKKREPVKEEEPPAQDMKVEAASDPEEAQKTSQPDAPVQAEAGFDLSKSDEAREKQDKELEKISGLNRREQQGAGEVAAAPSPAEALEDGDKAEAQAAAKETEAAKDKPAGKRSKGGRLTVAKEKVAEREKKRKRHRVGERPPQRQEFVMPDKPRTLEVEIPEHISVRELAARMSMKSKDLADKLTEVLDVDEEVEQLDQDTAVLIVDELGHKAVRARSNGQSEFIDKLKSNVGTEVITRHPVVTIMGHVDHGKTSLLDYIRKTKVSEGESGGITQHIGAYHVDSAGGKITFIDTPGHEVFTEMRARGAKVTDIVVLVVAADDGVMNQTKEAMDHAKAAKVPIVVALNKIDVPNAMAREEVFKQLSAEGLQPEEWGGETMVVPVSAKTGEGVDKLLESITLTAELLDLKAPVDVDAYGTVIEARKEKGLGPMISAIVSAGTLRKGQFVLCDTEFGKIRALRDEDGKTVSEVGPSMPVQIQGIPDLPMVGCEFFVADTEGKAREHANERKETLRTQELANEQSVQADTFEELLQQTQSEEERKDLNLVIKADVAGTCEALEQALAKIGNEDASVKVLHSGVGQVTDTDVVLADASAATLIGFRVTANSRTRKAITERGISSFFSDVLYEVTNYVTAQVEGLLAPTIEERVLGVATVKEVFSIHKVGRIAGCAVTEGQIDTSKQVRVVRDGVLVYKTTIKELRHFKNKVSSVNAGSDCGINLERFSDFKPGDTIESYEEVVSKRTL